VSCLSVFGWWVSYLLPPPYGVISLKRHGSGMASDRTKVTAVPLVLVRSVWCACYCQSKHARPSLNLSLSSPGVMTGERSCIFRVVKAGERVVVNPGLGIGLACSSKLGLGRSGRCYPMSCRPHDLLFIRCLETPRGHNPDSSPRAFLQPRSDHESTNM
jgi:hypothetical protein